MIAQEPCRVDRRGSCAEIMFSSCFVPNPQGGRVEAVVPGGADFLCLAPVGGMAFTAARGHDRNAGHLEGGSGDDPGFHGRVPIAKSDLPRRRWYRNEPRQSRPKISAASAARNRTCTARAAVPSWSRSSIPMARAKDPAIPWANRRGGGAGSRRTAPGRWARVRL